MSRVLHLTLKKKWFDMILSGEKKEEYREIKPFWISRLKFDLWDNKPFDVVHFYNGGSPCLEYPNFKIECNGIRVGKCRPEWSGNAVGDHFIILLGNILETNNIK